MPLNSIQLEQISPSVTNILHNPLLNTLKTDAASDPEKHAHHINKLLNSSKTRQRGLLLLSELIPFLSKPIVSNNAIFWINICLGHPDTIKNSELVTISKVIDEAHKSPDFDRKFTNDVLPNLVKLILCRPKNADCEAVIDCLTACLKCYPKWFNLHIKNVENYLLEYLDCTTLRVTKKAARAFCYLLQSGSCGVKDINYVNNFSSQYHRICATIQSLYDVLYKGLLEIEILTLSSEAPIEFNASLNNYQTSEVYSRTVTRLINCFAFLTIMNNTRFPATKIIKLNCVIDLVNRGMAQHVCIKAGGLSLDDYHRMSVINYLQVYIMKFFRSIIMNYKRNMLPFSHKTTQLLLDMVNRTHTCECFDSCYSFQETLFDLLRIWMKIINRIESDNERKLLVSILDYVNPIQDVTLLLDQESSTKKKKKKALINETIDRISRSNNGVSFSDANTSILKSKEKKCQLALMFLNETFTRAILKTDRTLLQIYSTVLNLLVDISANKISSPYEHSPKCQFLLYQVLVSLVEQEDVSVPNLELISRVLKHGVHSENFQISSECFKGLKAVEKICIPVLRKVCQKCPHLCEEDESSFSAHQESNDDNDTDAIYNKEVCLDLTEEPASLIVTNHHSKKKIPEEVIVIEEDVIETIVVENDDKNGDIVEIVSENEKSEKIKILDYQILNPASPDVIELDGTEQPVKKVKIDCDDEFKPIEEMQLEKEEDDVQKMLDSFTDDVVDN